MKNVHFGIYHPLYHYTLVAVQNEEQKQLKHSLDVAKRRIEELDRLIQKVYEDSILGKISEMRYKKMVASFEGEQQALIQFTNANSDKLSEIEKIQQIFVLFLRLFGHIRK